MALEVYDLAVVGGGPGGYPGALYAAMKGKSVVLVEAEGLGGECTGFGCVPTKALLSLAAAVFEARRWGAAVRVGPGDVVERVKRLVARLRDGIGFLLEKRGVTVVRGFARLVARGEIAVEGEEGGSRIGYRSLLLAPGSLSYVPKSMLAGGARVYDNRAALRELVGDPPGEVLVVGGGAAGVEFAQVFAGLGSRVVLVEALKRLLPGMEPGLGAYASRLLRRLGVAVVKGCPVNSLTPRGERVEAVICGKRYLFDAVIALTGRRPRTRGLGLEDVGVETDEAGFIRVDENLRTSISNIYAAGDAAGPPLLAHKAIHQSLVASSNAIGERARYNPHATPMVVYGLVELAQVGYTSMYEARKNGYTSARELRIRLGGVSYAAISGAEDGYVKLVYDPEDGRLLGLAAASPHASDMAAAAALIMAGNISLEDAVEILYPHPSAIEALYEALMAALGRPLHYILG